MLLKIINLIKTNIFHFIKTPSLIKKLLFYRVYFGKNKNTKKVILFDNFEVVDHIEKRVFILKQLQNISNANFYYFGKIRSLLIYIIYKCLGANYLKFKLSKEEINKLNKIHDKFLKKIKSKKDVINLKIYGINFGTDLYESYLRNYSKATLDIKDQKFVTLLKQSLILIFFWKNFFLKYRVKSVLISHRNFINTNIVCKFAYKYKVPVYTLNGSGNRLSRFIDDRLDECKYYSHYFNKLSKKEKRIGINLSKKQLNKRFKGMVGVNMKYSTKSAFKRNITRKQIVTDANKTNVLICTHCFYDNPHAYGGNLFLDFYEWISFLGKLSYETKYNWYIKPHPDYLPGTIEIINQLMIKFKSIKLVDPDCSFHQLKNEGLDYVLTTYGSVAHELPLLDINVINADKYNPNCSFRYSKTPKNLKDYKKILLSLGKRKLNNTKFKSDIYKFYYIHYYFMQGKKLFEEDNESSFLKLDYFQSKSKIRNKLEGKLVKYFLNNKKYSLENYKMAIIKNYEKS